MDLSLETVNLPEYFVQLLNYDLMAREKAYKHYIMGIERSKSLDSLIKRYFNDELSPDRGIQSILNSIGGMGLRDKLCSVFMEESYLGRPPLVPDHMYVSEILLFEDLLKDFTVSGVSRSFLLGFFLASLKAKKGEEFYHDEYLTPAFLAVMKHSQGRAVKIDWLVLLFFHFFQFFGEKKCIEMLNLGQGYQDFYQALNPTQRAQMVQNLMLYGQSVYDQEIFISEFIE